MALSAAVVLASCVKTDPAAQSVGDGKLVNVTITANLQNASATRALTVDVPGTCQVRYVLEAYRSGSATPQQWIQFDDPIFVIQLVSSQTYDFAAWADFVDGTTDNIFYDISAGLKAIKLYPAAQKYDGNDPMRDAFFKWLPTQTITPTYGAEMILKRPFAQIRVKTTDWKAVPDDLKPTKVLIEYGPDSKCYDQFDVSTGIASGSGYTPEFNAAVALVGDNIPYSDDAAAGEMWFSFDYLLANVTGDTEAPLSVTTNTDRAIDFTMTFSGSASGADISKTVTNVPYRQNTRTTVYGNLLTVNTVIRLIIEPDFINQDGQDPNFEKLVTIDKMSDLQTILDNYTDTKDVSYYVDSVDVAKLTIPAAFDGTVPAVTVYVKANIGAAGDFTVESESGDYDGMVSFFLMDGASKNSNLDVELSKGSFTLNGDIYDLSGSFAPGTLIITKGSTVYGDLTVNAGIAEVYGTVKGNATTTGTGKVFWGVGSGDDITAAFAKSANDGIIFTNNITDNRNIFIPATKVGYVIDGKGYTFSGNFTVDGEGNIPCKNAILIKAADVTVRNLTITNTNVNGSGMTVYVVGGATLENLNLKNNHNAGVIVNGANVTIKGTYTSSGNTWGGIELGQGSGVAGTPLLTLDDLSTVNITDDVPIYADFAGADENTFSATGWYCAEKQLYKNPVVFVWRVGNSTIIAIANSTNDLKATIEALQPGEEVFLAKGTYSVSSSITVPSGVTITGEEGTVIQPASSAANPMFDVTGASDVTFDGLDIELTANLIKGIRSDGPSSNIVVTNCEFGGAGYDPTAQSSATYVYLQNSDSPQITDNTFDNITDKAVYLNNVSGITVVSGNKIADGETINGAIQAENSSGTLTISSNTITGIKSRDPGSSSSADKGSAINLYSSNNQPTINVSGNTITDCDRGIMVYKCNGQQITIENNPMSGNTLFDVGFDSLGNQAYTVNINVTNSGTNHLARNNWNYANGSLWANLNIVTDTTFGEVHN